MKNSEKITQSGFSLGQLMVGMFVSTLAIWGTTEFIVSTNRKQIRMESQSLLDALHLNSMDEIMYYDRGSADGTSGNGVNSALAGVVASSPALKLCLLGKGTGCNGGQFTNDADGNQTFGVLNSEGFAYPPQAAPPNAGAVALDGRFNNFYQLRAGVNPIAGAAATCGLGQRNCVQRITRYWFVCPNGESCTSAQVALLTRYTANDLKLSPRSNILSISALFLAGNKMSLNSRCLSTNTNTAMATKYTVDNTGRGTFECSHSWNGVYDAAYPLANDVFQGAFNTTSNTAPVSAKRALNSRGPCAANSGIGSGVLFDAIHPMTANSNADDDVFNCTSSNYD